MGQGIFINVLRFGGGVACYVLVRRGFDGPWWAASLASMVGFFGLPMLVAFVGMKATRAVLVRSPEGRAAVEAQEFEQARARKRLDEIEAAKRRGIRPDPEEEKEIRNILFGE